jgi:hypothetical protein
MRFIRFVPALVVVGVLLVVSATGAGATNPSTGNGAPSGWHYNLNIHGVAKGQGFDSSADNQGHNIWVPLWGSCKINLQMGDYDVLDSDCVNGDAMFQPNPADNTTGFLAYSVYARALTKGSASMSACFTDTTIVPNETICNVGTLVVPLNKTTPPKFVNVSRELLQVCVNGSLQPLFANSNFEYSWSYDNQGLRMAQLRFYPLETIPMGGAC